MADIRTFLIDLKKFGDQQPVLLSQMIRRAAFLVLHDLVQGSPVRTGRFQSSWFIGIGKPNRSIAPPRASNAGAAAESLARLAALTPASVTGTSPVIISNNLPYGPALADGHSRQAPRGWIKAAVSRAARELNVVKVK